MKKINSLHDVLIEELADLLNAESQLVEASPKMAQASQSPALKNALEDCLGITREHIKRLQDIFSKIGQKPPELTCKAIQGFIAESENVVNDPERSPDRDAAIISVAQRVERYEIAGYKIAREHAADLGHTRIVELLNKTLDEERAMNFHLNELAQRMINVQAIAPQRGGFYMPEKKFSRGGIKKKSKNADVSRFISEGNPNIQEDNDKGKEKEDQNSQNPKDQGDLS